MNNEFLMFLGVLLAALIIAFKTIIDQQKKIELLKADLSSTQDRANYYYRLYQNARLENRQRVISKCTKDIPKGTIQAVKEAMKRAHPDNGGTAEDFQIYRRAYNVLTGKEKL